MRTETLAVTRLTATLNFRNPPKSKPRAPRCGHFVVTLDRQIDTDSDSPTVSYTGRVFLFRNGESADTYLHFRLADTSAERMFKGFSAFHDKVATFLTGGDRAEQAEFARLLSLEVDAMCERDTGNPAEDYPEFVDAFGCLMRWTGAAAIA